jgi:hypothetical protein
MSASLDGLDAGLADAARALDSAVHASGLQGRFSSTIRTSAEQKRLYDRFLAGQSQFPAVPPGFSTHEYGLAFDYVVSPWDYQPDVGALWLSWGGAWSASDLVHFELPGASAAVSEYARTQLGAQDATKTGFWEQFITGLPISFWPSTLFSLLGIPSDAKKTVTPEQEAYLRELVHKLP